MLSKDEKSEEERVRLRALEPLEEDPFPDAHGVLYSDLIRHFSSKDIYGNQALIDPFEEKRMHVAGYKLTVGDEYYRDGAIYYLGSYGDAPQEARRDYLEIPPFEVVIIKTRETLCLPRFLIGRWNIVVKQAYRGLLWVGGPQVDPGYVGHLFCPIYNLSDQSVRLDEREEIALIDFVKTTPYPYRGWPESEGGNAPKWVRQGLTDRPTIEKYVENGLRSALYTKAALRLDTLDKETKELAGRFGTITMFMLGALAVIPALLATMLPFHDVSGFTASLWGPFAIGLSTFAFAHSIANRVVIAERIRSFWIQTILPAGLAVAFFLVTLSATYPPTAAYIEGFARDANQFGQRVSEAEDRASSLLKEVNEIGRRQAVQEALLPELNNRIQELRSELLEIRRQLSRSTGGEEAD